MGQTIKIFGKPFAVDWQSSNRRLIACRKDQTCYELVSFDFLKSDDDEVLRRGLPNQIFKGCVSLPKKHDGTILFTSSFPNPGWVSVPNLICGTEIRQWTPPPKIDSATKERLTKIANRLLPVDDLVDRGYTPSVN